MKQKVELRYVAAPLISIIAFIILIGGASYAYYSQSVGGATSASNIANANLTVPRGCSFLANATNCSITSSTATTTSFTDSVVTRAEMSQAYSGNSVAQSTCALNIGVQGQAGCKCSYTVTVVGQTTTNFVNGSLKVNVAKDGTNQTILPSTYQEVEYIGSTGTQFIDLPFGFDRTDIVDFDMSVDTNQTTDKYLVSPNSWNNNNNRFAMGIGMHYPNLAVGFGSKSTDNTDLSPSVANDGERHQWHYQNSVFTILDLGVSYNGTSDTFGGTTTNLRLFYGYNANTKGKIYRYVHWKNGSKRVELIPCYRKSDNVIGLYDIINGTFYTNNGSGTFSKGSNVTSTEFDASLSYKNTGTITVSSTGTAVYTNYSLTLKVYNVPRSQNYQSGQSYVYYLRATPTCTVA